MLCCGVQSGRFGLGRGSNHKRAATNGSLPTGPTADAGGLPGDALSQDFHAKLLHLAWHPEVNLIAAAASNSLYMYYAR